MTVMDSFQTIPDAFFDSARRNARRIALVAEGGQGKQYTYHETAELVSRLAAGLLNTGLIADKDIGLLSENRPEWAISYLAIQAAGGTVVPIDANLSEKEIGYIIGHARLRVVFASGKFEDFLNSLPGNIKVVSLEESSPQSWQHLLAGDDSTVKRTLSHTVTVNRGNVAVLIYTSGTTGAPKAVELTHGNLLSNLKGITVSLPFDESDTFLSVLPLHHTFEATCGFLTPIIYGAKIVYARSLKSKEILEDIGNNSVTVMCGVPLLYEKMYLAIRQKLDSLPLMKKMLFKTMFTASALSWAAGGKLGKSIFKGLREKAGLGTIRMFVSGGAAIPPVIARFYNVIGFDFMQGYGMTEASPVISVNRPGNIKFGSVGPPLENVEVRIDNPDENGIGEIVVKGGNVSPGYRDNKEATREILRDGWLYTGDLGCLKEGHLWITGRRKNLIVSAGGKNIYPEELEEKLTESPAILEAVVFGRRKDTKQGEEVWALIVPDLEYISESTGTPLEQLVMKEVSEVVKKEVAEINGHIAPYKRIGNFDIQLEELEKTSTKKIKRFLYK